MTTMTQEEREIRARYPYLSDVGVKHAMAPMEYFVDYVDDALYARELARRQGVEECVDPANVTRSVDAKTLLAARRIARRILKEQPLSCPQIYRRTGIWQADEVVLGYRVPQWHVDDYECVESVEAK